VTKRACSHSGDRPSTLLDHINRLFPALIVVDSFFYIHPI
jgi:hypothetical protein